MHEQSSQIFQMISFANVSDIKLLNRRKMLVFLKFYKNQGGVGEIFYIISTTGP